MKIRPATNADIEQLIVLNGHVQSLHAAALPELFKKDPPAIDVRATFAKCLADPTAIVLIAEHDDGPIGYLYAQLHDRPDTWFRPPIKTCNISHLAVAPASRKEGVARSLIAEVRALAAARGFHRVELDVWSFNQAAREAFVRLGFNVFNERMVLS